MAAPAPPSSAPPALTLFGRPRLRLGAAAIDFVAERRFQVLALLALRGDWVHRDELAGLFWPDQPDALARTNVRKSLFRIRESFGLLPLESRAAEVRWLVESDASELLAAAAASRWDEVAACYRGPLLLGLDDDAAPAFSTWLEHERRRFLEHARTALLALLEHAVAAGEHARAIELAERLLEHDRLDETALAAWGNAQTASGRPELAARRYQQFARLLADELAVVPSDQLRTQAAGWGRPSTDAALPPPTALDRFVGRRQEASELQALLARPECRLLSIVGPGGVGKSRLLRDALPTLQAALGMPALWLPLEDLSGVDEAPARLATLLGASLPQDGSSAEQLIALLGPSPRLLALDNAEHLADLGATVLDVATALPSLRVVVTSRARLRVHGEWVLPLEGLPVPDAQSRDADAAQAFDSVRLFVERARQAHPGFVVADYGDVVDIVQRVDGLPLAIELAAAWTRLLPPSEIAAELAHSIDLLADAEGRVSVRAVIDRSWNLIAPRERAVLSALSVFAGGFTPALARRICEAPLPVLAGLSDKSLLARDAEGRLAMHPLIHRLMQERAQADAGAWAALRLRHAESFASWLQELLPQMRAAPVRSARAIEGEHANCRAALQFAAAFGHGRLLRPIANTLSLAYIAQTRFREGVALFEETLALAGADAACRAPLLHALATLHYRQGHLDFAERLAREAMGQARRSHDRATLYRSLHTLALACHTRGDHAEALRYFEGGVRRLRRDGEPVGLRAFVNGLGMALKGVGRLDEAAAVYEEALALARAMGDVAGGIALHNNIGNLHRSRRDFRSALRCFDEGLELARDDSTDWARNFLHLNRGLALYEIGDGEESRRVLSAVLAHCRLEPQAQIAVAAHQGLARNAVRDGRLDEAGVHLARAARLARDGDLDESFAQTLLYAAEADLARGERLAAASKLLWAAERPLDDADRRHLRALLISVGLDDDEGKTCRRVAEATNEAAFLTALEDAVAGSPGDS